MATAARACFLARFEISIAVDLLCAALTEVKESAPALRGNASIRRSVGPGRQQSPIER
jgi:hypothetical protein